ncbi:hypothetical protein D3C87_2036210 [compost metagenome]
MAAFQPARPAVDVEAGLELLAGNAAVGGDILPAIGQRSREIALPEMLAQEEAGLEQV